MSRLAIPLLMRSGNWTECDPSEASHLGIVIPGPCGRLTLPVITRGSRAGTGAWSWNGSTEAPTLRPSVAASAPGLFSCHTWINDGKSVHLGDCTCGFSGQTVDLLPVDQEATG